jgi:hypothetical protein
VAVRRFPVPAWAPPFDDKASQAPVPPSVRAQALEQGLAPDRERRPAGPGRTRRPEQPPAEGGWAGVRVGGWPSQFAQVLAEALAGSRPAHQVRPWTTEQARRRIRQLGPVLQASQRPRVRRVLTSAPSRGVVEMMVIVGLGPRTRALAVRLEHAGPEHAGRGQENRQWLCTAIEAA